MAKKLKKKNGKSDDPDTFFEKSPFSCESMVTLEFEKGDSLKIHRDLLDRNPKLAALQDAKTDPRSGRLVSNPPLEHISRSAGHVLVQYLYTDTYRTLKWVGPVDSHKETVAKIETAFEVYALAGNFDLEALGILARKEITLLSKHVDAFTIIEIVKKAYPCAKRNDTWFPGFLKDTIRVAFETPPAPPPLPAETTSEVNTDDVPAEAQTDEDVTLATLLLQGALEVYREKIDALPAKVHFTVKLTPKPAAEPEPVEEAKQVEPEPEKKDDFWGATTMKKKASIWDPVPEPAEETTQVEPEPEKKEDDFWGATAMKKKKKASIWDPVPEPVEETTQVEPEPEKEAEADFWAAPVKKRSKKKIKS